jgi:hypothetical protein
MKAMRASGSGLSKSGDALAAGAGDSGGVVTGDGVGGLRGAVRSSDIGFHLGSGQ